MTTESPETKKEIKVLEDVKIGEFTFKLNRKVPYTVDLELTKELDDIIDLESGSPSAKTQRRTDDWVAKVFHTYLVDYDAKCLDGMVNENNFFNNLAVEVFNAGRNKTSFLGLTYSTTSLGVVKSTS